MKVLTCAAQTAWDVKNRKNKKRTLSAVLIP